MCSRHAATVWVKPGPPNESSSLYRDVYTRTPLPRGWAPPSLSLLLQEIRQTSSYTLALSGWFLGSTTVPQFKLQNAKEKKSSFGLSRWPSESPYLGA